MKKLNILNYFTFILSEMCTLEEYRGEEETTLQVVVTGENYTSICPNRLKMFTNCKVLKVLKTKLEQIPTGVEYLQNLKELYFIRNNSIGTDEDFARLGKLKNLKTIHLQHNNVKEIPACLRAKSALYTKIGDFISAHKSIANLFSYFPYKAQLENFFSYCTANTNFAALKELNINDNQITKIPIEFCTLNELEILSLAKNNIINITIAMGLLCNLTYLNLSKNKIQTIPDNICMLKSLTKCNFSDNQITTMPLSFFTLKKLKLVNIANNKLEKLDIFKGNLDRLVALDIANNQINNFFIEKNSLPNLKYLFASNNKLQKLSQCFYFPKSLRYLYLSNNLLGILPQLKNVKKLSTLDLSQNQLKTLPIEICLLENLTFLDVSFNFLVELPDNLGNLKMLTRAVFNNNKLSVLPSSFSTLKNIAALNLSDNTFHKIPIEILDLDNLVTLFFNDNLLTNLGPTDISLPLISISSDKNGFNVQIESFVCNKTIFSLKKLQNLSFDNNKITEISSNIKLLKNLNELSLKNNEIKTIPEEIGELKELKVLNLESNFLRYLPRSIKNLRTYSLASLEIDENLIPRYDTEYGLGIDSIIKLDFVELKHRPQYNIATIDDVVSDMEKDNVHWNINELKTIKLPIDISEFSTKISDKQMRKIWRVVLKYFIVSKEMIEEQDSESTDDGNVVNTDIDDKITQITAMGAFKEIKANAKKGVKYLVFDENGNTNLPLYKRVSKLLRDNSKPQTENPIVTYKMQELLKNSIKAIFYKFLEKIIEDRNNLESLELIKIAITELCENKILTCIDGQLEGLQYYYSMFYSSGNEVTNNSIVDFIRDTIASIKEVAFVDVTNGKSENGVHKISRWRAVFKDFLGIQHSFDDPYAHMFSSGSSKYRTGKVLNRFFKKFTVENVVSELLKKINETEAKLKESAALLKDILKLEQPEADDYTLYMNVIESYFEYTSIIGYSEIRPKKLKKNGLIKILLYLQILKENKGNNKLESFI